MRVVLAMIGFGLGGSIGLLMFSKTLLGGVLSLAACLLLVALALASDALAPVLSAARAYRRRPRRREMQGQMPAMKPLPAPRHVPAPGPARVARPVWDARRMDSARVTHSAIILSDPEADDAMSARRRRPDPMRAAVTDPTILPV